MKYLNLGCGSKFHEEWINADMYAASEFVIECNFLNGIPFPDNFFDVVYHSHVLEHFPKFKAVSFIIECYRILKPGGVIRIVVPDLEKITQEYVRHLKRIDDGDLSAQFDYDWIMLELFDQVVRIKKGGEMAKYLSQPNIPNLKYIESRIGKISEVNKINLSLNSSVSEKHLNTIKYLKPPKNSVSIVLDKLIKTKDRLLMNLLSDQQKTNISIGKFKQDGEVHQWMYDRHSIKQLLEKCGFNEFQIMSAEKSSIPEWGRFNLDNPHESASLFVECRKG